MDSRLSRSTHVRSRSRSPRIAARVGVLLVVLVVGIWLGGHPSWLPASIRSTLTDDSSGQLVNETLNMLTRDYYRPLNRTQLLNKVTSQPKRSSWPDATVLGHCSRLRP